MIDYQKLADQAKRQAETRNPLAKEERPVWVSYSIGSVLAAIGFVLWIFLAGFAQVPEHFKER